MASSSAAAVRGCAPAEGLRMAELLASLSFAFDLDDSA
jgi:hypothetical protein